MATVGPGEQWSPWGRDARVSLGSFHPELRESEWPQTWNPGSGLRSTECSMTLSQGQSQNQLLLVPTRNLV